MNRPEPVPEVAVDTAARQDNLQRVFVFRVIWCDAQDHETSDVGCADLSRMAGDPPECGRTRSI